MLRELRSFEQLRKSWYVLFFQIPWLPEWILGRDEGRGVADAIASSCMIKEKFPPEVLEVYRRNAAQPGALTAMINYYRALFRDAVRRGISPMPVIHTPTLLIWGEEDVALSKACTYGTDQFVANLQVRYLPGISHWVQQEAPATVNAMIGAFLQDKPVPEMEAGNLPPKTGPVNYG
jgi:epoxide hydrolase 4